MQNLIYNLILLSILTISTGDNVPKKIVFSRGWRIFIINEDGTNEQFLTDGDYPSWSPDGKRIIFHAWGDSFPQIQIIDADGKNIDTLLRTGDILNKGLAVPEGHWEECYPRISPDGREVVVPLVIIGAGKPELFIMDIDGKNLERLTYTQGDSVNVYPYWSPDWSPDGKRIVFIRRPWWRVLIDDTGEDRYVYVIDADGKNERKLTEGNADRFYPVWLKDGRIAFCIGKPLEKQISGPFRNRPSWNVMVINPDGTNCKLLYENMYYPSLSIDGERIVFCESVEVDSISYSSVVTMNSNGSNRKVIIKHGAIKYPQFQP